MNPFIKTFVASGAIGHRRLWKYTATDGVIAQASAATDLIGGVIDFPGGVASGARVDAVLFGPADVECGGTIAPGAQITSDADGKAVAAAPGTGVNHRIGGRLLVNGASGDIARSFINPGQIQG